MEVQELAIVVSQTRLFSLSCSRYTAPHLRGFVQVRDFKPSFIVSERQMPVLDPAGAKGPALDPARQNVLADGGEGARAHLVQGEDAGGLGGDAEADKAGGAGDKEGGVRSEVEGLRVEEGISVMGAGV